jgi:hypothetical protein
VWRSNFATLSPYNLTHWLVSTQVALSVGDLADAWEHDIASINEPEDEDASHEREALRARATPPSTNQRKSSIGAERARLEKIVVEKQGAERSTPASWLCVFFTFDPLRHRGDALTPLPSQARGRAAAPAFT